ncbi:MAG TPA: tRNA (guanosine(46)-N7)-methyltransferase TrmB [Peptococcaceae bacterium]|nr:tRNA (guanosine(46)-N7)-methyltransferase TrmB [Peptococcaceae bacterium]
MRMRRNHQAEENLKTMPGVLPGSPKSLYGHWEEVFQRKAPLHLELGMGKGDFIIGMAQKHPEFNFIGVERVPEVQYVAAQKNLKEPLPNLRFLSLDAVELELFFQPGEVDRIYLNFSDPWPKKRHAKRRLTYVDMLKIYQKILKPGGQIHFKTDGEPFFEFSLEQFREAGMSFGKISRDLHHSGFEDNVMTEYEKRFSELGLPIYRCEVWNG